MDFLEEPEAPDREKITIEVDGETGRGSLKDRLMALNWRPIMIAYARAMPLCGNSPLEMLVSDCWAETRPIYAW